MKLKVDHTIPKEFIQLTIVDRFPEYFETFEIIEEDKYRFYRSEYIFPYTVLNLNLEQKDVLNILSEDEQICKFLPEFYGIIKPMFEISEKIRENGELLRDANPLFIHYECTNGKIFQFIPNDYNISDFIVLMKNASIIIKDYEDGIETEIVQKVKQVHISEDNLVFFENDDSHWKIIEPLREVAKNISEQYFAERDPRSSKPDVIIDRDNLSKKINIGNNWVLDYEGRELFMSKPNDISLYANISRNHLEKAIATYDELKPKISNWIVGFPGQVQQTEIFDYFERIIQAIIFSYTSLEAMANLLIPYNYEHTTTKNGITTIYNKEAIERFYSLGDKFKSILKDILSTTDVSREPWWAKFIELEKIRNEIVHSKPSKSEDRYNKILNTNIFDIIRINESILDYYGVNIMSKKPYLINEFPMGYGFDETWPGLTDKEGYRTSWNTLNNIEEE